ncbi:MAG TPA: hypothetical protein VG271_04755 [Beijerinckiaceae bacterium]|nr:hypothetical protein [Beijerinckiaceae bacterium]
MKQLSCVFFVAISFAALVCAASTVSAQDFMKDMQQAARGMGYANGVYRSHKCKAFEIPALNLQHDIMEYYSFTSDDLEGKTEIGKSVNKGRAAAARDARYPREFCDRMEEVLGLWRSEVLPSPR